MHVPTRHAQAPVHGTDLRLRNCVLLHPAAGLPPVTLGRRVVIKASASSEIRALVDALTNSEANGPADEAHRESAIARLAIIGGRAVGRLLDAYAKTTERRTQVAIL